MSLYSDASLAMIPSAYKDGKLYSIKPTDGSGDFTFSRGSNLAATRVDENGLIEKGRENLLLQSNSFDTSWSIDDASVTSGQSGYDGTNDAWLFTTTIAGATLKQSITASGVVVFSMYAKKGTVNGIRLRIDAATDADAYFNLSNGSVHSFTGSAIDASMISLGSGWYRCQMSANISSPVKVAVYTTDGTTAYDNGNIYIQDAQLEAGLVATDYIETTTTTAQAGILEDMPRLDYSGGASCPSLLLEPQRTNLIDQSEYLSVWAATRCVISDNDTTSPDGAINASKMTSNDAAESYIQRNATLSGSIVAYSFYAKKGDLDYVHSLVWDVSANGCRQWFNLANGTIGSSTTFGSGYSVNSASIEDMGNGWYRCITIVNCSSGTNGFRVNISSADSNINSPVNSYGYFWGIQAEDSSSYPTSYIPCYGAATTRSKDNMGTTFSSPLTSSGEVSVLFDIDGAYNSDVNSTGDNIAFFFSNDDRIIYNQNSVGFHRIEINVAGRTEYIYLTTSVDRVDRARICIVVTASTYEMYVNGTLETSGSFTGTGNWTSCDKLSNSMTNAIAVVPMQQLVYFPTALTSSEAIALTTI